ncbi:hypothetical protein KI387_003965, partial [Taxus chinensis]
MPSDLEEFAVFLKEGVVLEGMKALENNHLTIHIVPYMLISGDLYKLGCNEVLRKYVLEHECLSIMEEEHRGSVGGYYAGDATMRKILMEIL